MVKYVSVWMNLSWHVCLWVGLNSKNKDKSILVEKKSYCGLNLRRFTQMSDKACPDARQKSVASGQNG